MAFFVTTDMFIYRCIFSYNRYIIIWINIWTMNITTVLNAEFIVAD